MHCTPSFFRFHFFTALVSLLLAVVPATALAQSVQWSRVGGLGSGPTDSRLGSNDLVAGKRSLAVDPSGNVILVGTSSFEGNVDFRTAKYSATDGSLAWQRVFNGAVNGEDRAYAAATDAAGNVFVAGLSEGYPDFRIKTIKYAAADGTILWEQARDGASGRDGAIIALAIDAAGNAIVAGCTFGIGNQCAFSTTKYAAASGAILWERTYASGEGAGDRTPVAIALDGAGNVHVTGIRGSFPFDSEVATIKYAAGDGATLWERVIGSAAGTANRPNGMAIDPAGNVLVTGIARTGNATAARTFRLAAADGTVLWDKVLDAGAGVDTQAFAVASDAGGNAFVTGFASGAGARDMKTLKYAAADGAVLWEKSFDGPAGGDDAAYAVAVDAGGNAVVAGFVTAGGGFEFVTLKYSAAGGDVLWSARYQGTGSDFSEARAVAIDGAGAIVAAGYSTESIFGPGFKAIKRDPSDGALAWATAGDASILGAFVPQPDPAPRRALAADSTGNAIVIGHGRNGATIDMRTIKYAASNGAVVWEKAYDGGPGSDDRASAVAVDAAGNAFVVGSRRDGAGAGFQTIKYAAADGSVLWEKYFPGSPFGISEAVAVAVDAQGNAFVTGRLSNGADGDFKTIKYAGADGTILWDRTTDGGAGDDVPSAMVIDAGGNVIVTGRSANGANSDFRTVKYAGADGTVVWNRSHVGSGNGHDFALAIGVDRSGHVIVTGAEGTLSGGQDIRTIKYDATSGNILWQASFGGLAASDDEGLALAIDSAGNAIVAGRSFPDGRVIKYAAADGNVVWERPYPDPADIGLGVDVAYAVAIDGSHDVIVTGSSDDGAIGEFRTVKYSGASGNVLWSHVHEAGSAGFGVAAVAVNGAVYVAGNCVSGGNPMGICTVRLENAVTTAIPRLVNLSTRAPVLTGDNVLIGGFIIGGSQAKTVVIRARGPSLSGAGVAGALANPLLQLFAGASQVAVNDNWGNAANATAIQASGFAPGHPLESAILVTLAPGAYTAIVTGAGGSTGVGLVEVFEVDLPEIPLVNIATRGVVLSGDNVMIGGFVIQGDAPRTVVVRARGPSLTAAGVPGALANPLLQLFSGATQIAVNDNWQTAANAQAIQASGFAPLDPNESAILITLAPGAYTAIVTGAGGTTGVGIIEVFAQ